MLDQFLSWMVVFVPFALSIVPIFVPAKAENETSHRRWRYILVGFGVAFSILAWWQQSRAVKASAKGRESAITETSERVATDTAARVTEKVGRLYTTTINELNQDIAGLKQQLTSQGTAQFSATMLLVHNIDLNNKAQISLDNEIINEHRKQTEEVRLKRKAIGLSTDLLSFTVDWESKSQAINKEEATFAPPGTPPRVEAWTGKHIVLDNEMRPKAKAAYQGPTLDVLRQIEAIGEDATGIHKSRVEAATSKCTNFNNSFAITQCANEVGTIGREMY